MRVGALLVAASLATGCGAAVEEPAGQREVPGEVAVSVPPSSAPPASDPAGARTHPRLPQERTVPRYLTRTYRAPAAPGVQAPAGRPGAAGTVGTLRIPALRVSAPVDAVGLDRGVMAIPDNPARIGWLRSTAALDDTIGASVLSAHVSDRRDVGGVLVRLRTVRRGAVITWSARGTSRKFVVTEIRRYPRSRGVPARLFRVDGGHVLHLVTCTDRRATPGGGFHYASNLVVTAREVPDPYS